jgi:hypothetical protein
MAVLSRRRFFLGWLGLMLIFRSAMGTAPRGLSEQELKAAALNQVVHFVRWPTSSFLDSSSPFVIGVYGRDPFDGVLDDLVRGENVSGHPIKLVHCFTPEAAANCHAVFISSADLRMADRLVHELSSRSILTVTDGQTVESLGAIIALTVSEHRIHIFANLGAARKANLALSSKLLSLAEIRKEHP